MLCELRVRWENVREGSWTLHPTFTSWLEPAPIFGGKKLRWSEVFKQVREPPSPPSLPPPLPFAVFPLLNCLRCD